jgi:hypothetical protein
MPRKPAKRPGRPRTSKLSRAEQLRLAKQRQRLRERAAGIRKLELPVPAADAERLRVAMADRGFREAAMALVGQYVVDIQEWPALRELAWNRADRWIPAAEAFALYERNWRHIDRDALGERERAFIAQLAERFGGGHLNV